MNDRAQSARSVVRGGVSVVVPVLNAGRHLNGLLPALLEQEPEPPCEILLLDSMSTDNTRTVAARFNAVRVLPVAEFSHGGARNLGARASAGEFVAFLSQDAMPLGSTWLARLLEPFEDASVAATFSRQTPRPEANPMERYFLRSHFPGGSPVRMARDARGQLSFQKGIFFSNVSSAVRREFLLRHPFDARLIMSEDQQFARDVIAAGYAVVYQPASVVEHSHNYTLKQAFQRYFDSVYSLRRIFPEHGMQASAALGLRYVRGELWFMLRRYPLRLPYYALYTLAKTAGTLAAHHAHRMPRSIARRCSQHKYFWNPPRA